MSRFNETYTLPFKFDIPNYTKEYVGKISLLRRWLKFIKRYLYINLKRQKTLVIENILPEHKERDFSNILFSIIWYIKLKWKSISFVKS
jgi:hypothetical protein